MATKLLMFTNYIGLLKLVKSLHVQQKRIKCVYSRSSCLLTGCVVELCTMSTHQRTRQSQLCVSSDSDSDDVPLRELVKNTPSKTGNVSDGTTGSYSRSQPLVTSTPKVFDNLKVNVQLM